MFGRELLSDCNFDVWRQGICQFLGISIKEFGDATYEFHDEAMLRGWDVGKHNERTRSLFFDWLRRRQERLNKARLPKAPIRLPKEEPKEEPKEKTVGSGTHSNDFVPKVDDGGYEYDDGLDYDEDAYYSSRMRSLMPDEPEYGLIEG